MPRTERLPALPYLSPRDRERTVGDEDLPAGVRGQYLLLADDRDLRLLPVDDGSLHLGRSAAADVVLDEPTVSRRHATIVRDGGRLHLHDDRSANGTFVNGRRITSVELVDGDVLFLGRVTVVFRDTTPVGRTHAAAA